MSRWKRFIGGVKGLSHRRAEDAQLDEELRGYIEDAAQGRIRGGMDAAEALRAARVEVGSVEAVKDEVRDVGWEALLESLVQDILYGVRSIRKAPGFAIVAVLTLALGIGANAAISGAAYSILLKPLEYSHPDRLVILWGRDTANPELALSIPEIDVVAKRAVAFDGIAAIENKLFWLVGSGPSKTLESGRVSGNFFSILGMQPALGRWILPSDTRQGVDHVVVLSYAIWQHQFGGDRDIIGKTIELTDGSSAPDKYQVVGVMPPQFASSGPRWIQQVIYFPLTPVANETVSFNWHGKLAIGRLKPGVTVQQANAELEAIGKAIAQEHPATNRGWTARAEPLHEIIVKHGRTPLFVLVAAVALIFLIACMNVSNLMLYRAWSRRREIGVRQALGASRLRIVRQFLIESLLLAPLGGALGVLLALWGIDALRVVAPASTPRLDELRFARAILWYSAAISLIAG